MCSRFFIFKEYNMYTDEQIDELFKNKIPQDKESQAYFSAYVNIYKCSFIRPTKSDKYNFHHLYCSFLAKSDWGEKNRYHTIERLDEIYKPNDNICKLRILYHVIAHWCLGMALRNTPFEIDARNAFYTLIGNYSKNIESYTFDEVKELGRLIEENSEPNQIDHYMTQSETKEYFKQKQKDYMEDWEEKHEEEILRNKEFMKQKRKESQEKWKEEHKDEIEERKRQQREYAKKMRAKYNANLSK